MDTQNAFGYNLRSEVASAAMGTNAYAYEYDPIGNRVQSAMAVGSGEACTNAYAANALNQYSNITYQSNSLQPDSLSPAYDLDGNMLTNGPWAYTWDAENRMASACSNGVLLVTNVYDHLSRRIRKEVFARANTTSNYEPVTCNTFLYDGWNVIRETALFNSLTPPIALTNYYTWGLDLSGTMQGAGGVGGLLAVISITSQPGTSPTLATFYPCYDANGNVTAYLDATGGVAIAFSYDPFGRTVSETVNALPGAAYLPHRFSTKYLDPETGLYYYGYRFYHPELGRWVCRDPIEERGFDNRSTYSHMVKLDGSSTYAFVVNAPIQYFDVLGMNLGIPGTCGYGCVTPPDPTPLPFSLPRLQLSSNDGCACCPTMKKALDDIASYLAKPKCKKWFRDHGAKGEHRTVSCASWLGGWTLPSWLPEITISGETYPSEVFFPSTNLGPGYLNQIVVSKAVCENYPIDEWRELLVHEMAHSYCFLLPGTRAEDCAKSAVKACDSEND